MTETHPKITVGIDVGKAHLGLSVNDGPTQTYPNDPEGIAAPTLELARYPAASQPGARLRPDLRAAGQNRPPGLSSPVPLRRRL